MKQPTAMEHKVVHLNIHTARERIHGKFSSVEKIIDSKYLGKRGGYVFFFSVPRRVKVGLEKITVIEK